MAKYQKIQESNMTLSVSTADLISATHYNSVFNSYVELLAGSTASYGNNLYAATTANQGQLATSAHWYTLFSDINRCHVHQTGQPIPGIYDLTSVPYWYSQWALDYIGQGTVNPLSQEPEITKYYLGEAIANAFYLPGTQVATVNGVARYGFYRNPDRESLYYWTNYAYSLGLTSATVASSQEFKNAFFWALDPDSSDFVRSITPPGPAKAFDDGGAVPSTETIPITFAALNILPFSGGLIKADFVNKMANTATFIVANSATVYAATQLASHTVNASIATSNWGNNSENKTILDADWTNSNNIHYFYNLGSYITTRIASSGTAQVGNASDNYYLEFVAHANAPHSTLYAPYLKSDWVNYSSTTTSYSTSTAGGVFTATVTYSKTSASIISIDATIRPPGGLSPLITLDAVASATIVHSVGAIVAPMPKITEYSKLLTASPGSLSFTVVTGTPTAAQTITLDNQGDETVTVQSITVSSNGASAYVANSVSTNQYGVASVDPILYPFPVGQETITNVVVFYNESISRTSNFGTFDNAMTIRSNSNYGDIRIPITVTVLPPVPEATLTPIDYTAPYTYSNWATDYGLNTLQREAGEDIANKFYLSNTDFGIISGVQRFGLYRKPDKAGLDFWARFYVTNLGQGFNDIDEFVPYFFAGIDPVGSDYTRSRTASKNFDEGYGYGDFYDGAFVVSSVNSSQIRSIINRLDVRNGTLISYTTSLSGFDYNGTPDSGLSNLFSVKNLPTGPTVTFNPNQFLYIGNYSLTVTANVETLNYAGSPVSITTSTNLTFTLSELLDGHLVDWVSGYEEYNGIIGISYDNIFGKRYLTVGIGSGADGSPELSGAGYTDAYVNINQLGKAGDLEYNQLGSGKIAVYKSPYFASWGSFMNEYAVWTMSDSTARPAGTTVTREFTFVAPSSGSYTVTGAIDDYASIYIDNALVLNPNSFTVPSSNVVSLTAGVHTIRLEFSNYRDLGEIASNPGGIAVRIVGDPGEVWSTLVPVRATTPYAYWREVYRVEIPPAFSTIYLNNAARVKETWPIKLGEGIYQFYSDFFGSGAAARSMMVITTDPSGNLSFNWNELTTLTGIDLYDRTLSGLQYLPYYGSSSLTRKKNIGTVAGDGTTEKIVGMTTTAVRTIRDQAPKSNSIEVQSTVYDSTVLGIQSYIKINGNTVVTNVSRGHTLAVINPYTYALESRATYDTWGANNSTELYNALLAVPSGKIVALISYDATALDASTRSLLVAKYGSTMRTSVWTRHRVAHSFVGRADVGTFGARERITTSNDLSRSYTYWPNGPTDTENFTNYGTVIVNDVQDGGPPGYNDQPTGDSGGQTTVTTISVPNENITITTITTTDGAGQVTGVTSITVANNGDGTVTTTTVSPNGNVTTTTDSLNPDGTTGPVTSVGTETGNAQTTTTGTLGLDMGTQTTTTTTTGDTTTTTTTTGDTTGAPGDGDVGTGDGTGTSSGTGDAGVGTGTGSGDL